MKLINSENSHEEILINCISKSNTIKIAVAFLKRSGLTILYPHIVEALQDNCDVVFIVGLDFGQTEPEALKAILHLTKHYGNCSLYLALPKQRSKIFHPKIYYFKMAQTISAIIGSANLTSGGLKDNHECSLYIEVDSKNNVVEEIENYFHATINSDFCAKATILHISQYEKFYQQQRNKRLSIQAKPTGCLSDINFNDQALKRYFTIYTERFDIKRDLIYRTKNYNKAKNILDTIADDKRLNKVRFIP